MKYLKIQLVIFFLITSIMSFSTETKGKTTSKNVWSRLEISHEMNKKLFLPLNNSITAYNRFEAEFDISLLDEGSMKWNLWTIISSNIMLSKLTLYSPYNPDDIEKEDEGFLKYPITAMTYGKKNGDFFNDKKFRSVLIRNGYLGIEYKMGDDSKEVERAYYADNDIISYKIRENWTLNKEGETIKKEIIAISPIVKVVNGYGETIGEKELFWVNFNELKSKLQSYLSYFENREFNSKIIRETIILD